MFSNFLSRFAPGPDPRAIDHEEFEQAVKAGKCVVVDVREAHEFASARRRNHMSARSPARCASCFAKA